MSFDLPDLQQRIASVLWIHEVRDHCRDPAEEEAGDEDFHLRKVAASVNESKDEQEGDEDDRDGDEEVLPPPVHFGYISLRQASLQAHVLGDADMSGSFIAIPSSRHCLSINMISPRGGLSR